MNNNFTSVESYYSYAQYLHLIEQLVAAGDTTGDEPTEDQIAFTRLNLHRMLRWNKTFLVDEKLVDVARASEPQVWWVFTEAWCGDGAQVIPLLQKITESSEGRISMRLLLRDENKEAMSHYLTNGGRAIPKLIAMSATGDELFTWGPRPVPAQQLMLEWKLSPGTKSHEDIEKELHLWYAKDKGICLMQEIMDKLQSVLSAQTLKVDHNSPILSKKA